MSARVYLQPFFFFFFIVLLPDCWRRPSWFSVEGSFLLPALLSGGSSVGETRSGGEDTAPAEEKNGPLILVLVSLGLPLGLEQIWFQC